MATDSWDCKLKESEQGIVFVYEKKILFSEIYRPQ